MEETTKRYDFRDMYDALSYMGCNDSYVRDIYIELLGKLRKLADLQDKGMISIKEED